MLMNMVAVTSWLNFLGSTGSRQEQITLLLLLMWLLAYKVPV